MSSAKHPQRLLSKDTLLADFRGGDKRRAAVALGLIEATATRFTIDRGSVNNPFLSEGAFSERSSAYLDAVAAGARRTSRIRVQQLEQSVDAWRSLVPDSPRIRAGIARLLQQKYPLSQRHVHGIADAVGLDDPDVQACFQTQEGKPLSSIYTDRISVLEQGRWTWTRLSTAIENLPPFWTAFALTLTETVGAGTLALPIAFATIGPLPGLVILVLVGLLNVLTVAWFAEASARNGSIRFGSAFVGRLVQDYLGTPASVVVRLSLFAFCCIVLASYYTGFASIVAAVTGIAAPVWVTVVFVTGLFLILRKSLLGTLASALLIGLINISILVILSFIALRHANAENLWRMEIPYVGGRAFEPAHLQLVFGVVLVAYFGHLSVSNCAQAVLRRDPGGKSLKWGTITAMLVAIAIYSLWSFSIGSAIGYERLARETGTALVPLAEQIGPEIYLFGAVFAVLGLGMSSVHFALGIFNLSRELTSNLSPGQSRSWLQRHTTTIVSVMPIALVFGYVQWTYSNGTPSFTAPLTLLGAILTPALAGIFPVLLLLASRAQGLPAHGARVSAVASHPIVLGVVGLLSYAALLFHGLLIWEDPLMKASALAMVAVLLVLTGVSIKRGHFSSLLRIEILHYSDKGDQALVSVTCHGRSVAATVYTCYRDGTTELLPSDGRLNRFNDCRSIQFHIPEAIHARRLQVSAYRISRAFDATPLHGRVHSTGAPAIDLSIEHVDDSNDVRQVGMRDRSPVQRYVTYEFADHEFA